MTEKFNNVPWDAPMFRKASLADLQLVVSYLSKASYHYADDTGREWGTAAACKENAAQLCNQHNLDFSAVDCLVKHEAQLVTVGDLIDFMLKDLRK